MQLKTESRIENTEDEHANSEHSKTSDSMDNRSEGRTVDVAEEKEETNLLEVFKNVSDLILSCSRISQQSFQNI